MLYALMFKKNFMIFVNTLLFLYVNYLWNSNLLKIIRNFPLFLFPSIPILLFSIKTIKISTKY